MTANPDAPIPDDAELDRIERRADAATDGPWDPYDPLWQVFDHRDDARFIAHAREDVPRLVAALRASRVEADELRRERDRAKEERASMLSRVYRIPPGEDGGGETWQQFGADMAADRDEQRTATENARWFETYQRHRAERAEEHVCALLEMVEPRCSYDHNGNCQAHYVEQPCRVAEARAALSRRGDA